MPEFVTRRQRLAQTAAKRVSERRGNGQLSQKYMSFAKSFPALIHVAGLCQAVAFAQNRSSEAGVARQQVLEDLRQVLAENGCALESTEALASKSRTESVPSYMRLSRLSLEAATWIKRYVEAFGAGSDDTGSEAGEGDNGQ